MPQTEIIVVLLIAVCARSSTPEPCICCQQVTEKLHGEHLECIVNVNCMQYCLGLLSFIMTLCHPLCVHFIIQKSIYELNSTSVFLCTILHAILYAG